MKKLTIAASALALAFGLAATGCKKKMSGRDVEGPGAEDGPSSGGCCRASSGADGALLPLGLVAFGLAGIARRRRTR